MLLKHLLVLLQPAWPEPLVAAPTERLLPQLLAMWQQPLSLRWLLLPVLQRESWLSAPRLPAVPAQPVAVPTAMQLL